MAKGTKRSKKRTVVAPSNGDDWLLRFLRQHSLGVILLALLSAAGGWVVWHSRDCLTDQKAQVAATRKAWIKMRIANQKFWDDGDVFIKRSELYKRHKEIGVEYAQWDQDRQALFEIVQALSKDCNDGKVATYEWEVQLKELSDAFPFYTPPKLIVDPELCGKMSRQAEELRSPEVAEAEDSDKGETNLHVSTSQLKETIATGRENDVKLAKLYESFFVRLENMSFVGRLKQCF
jgi:hypothetical protein